MQKIQETMTLICNWIHMWIEYYQQMEQKNSLLYPTEPLNRVMSTLVNRCIIPSLLSK